MHSRLTQYKRIAVATSSLQLEELKVEMIDRFGSLPEQTYNLFAIADLKLVCQQIGVSKIKAGAKSGMIEFAANAKVDPSAIIKLLQSKPSCYQLNGPQGLKFHSDCPLAKQRLEFIKDLLRQIASDGSKQLLG